MHQPNIILFRRRKARWGLYPLSLPPTALGPVRLPFSYEVAKVGPTTLTPKYYKAANPTAVEGQDHTYN